MRERETVQKRNTSREKYTSDYYISDSVEAALSTKRRKYSEEEAITRNIYSEISVYIQLKISLKREYD